MVTKGFLFLVAGVLFALAFISSCASDDVEDGSIEYGGQTYKIIVINGQQLLSQNLNYDVPGSKCYDNNSANCNRYGRLYNWVMAMALPPSCVSLSCIDKIGTPHRGICPNGWHIPTNAEWDKLYRFADGDNGTNSPYDSPTAGRYLKAKAGWNHCGPYSSPSSSGSSSSSGSDESYLCDDTLGFTALPGGYYNSIGFYEVGEYGHWWSASENEKDVSKAYKRYIFHRNDKAYWGYGIKNYFFSLRCFKD
jgi:Fibrobacter succinogenes major domain (Fib_succ_major).